MNQRNIPGSIKLELHQQHLSHPDNYHKQLFNSTLTMGVYGAWNGVFKSRNEKLFLWLKCLY